MEIRLKDGESFNIKGGDGLKVDGRSVGGSVEVVAPNASAVEGQAADAKKTYEALEKMAENTPAAPDLTPYAKTAEVLPRYPFVDAEIVDGTVTIAPYTIATLESDGVAAFTVVVREGNGYARDCVLTVNCREGSPSVIFDDTKFFPRGGDAANLEVVAGKRNVFFITEVQPNVFMVARDELALPNEGGGE